MMSCPYNANHRFAKEKLHNHLLKCKERKKSKRKLYHCYGNNMVVFFKEEKIIHEQTCAYCNRSLLQTQGMNESSLLNISEPEQSSLISEISIISSTPLQPNTTTMNNNNNNKHKATPTTNTNVESSLLNNNNNNNTMSVVDLIDQSQDDGILSSSNNYHNLMKENNTQSFINQEQSKLY